VDFVISSREAKKENRLDIKLNKIKLFLTAFKIGSTVSKKYILNEV
jgi:hypothetical protein